MKKIYTSGTCLSLNIRLESGKNLHVSFDAKSDGSSSYITDNENIQKGLERHYLFGEKFRLHKVVEEEELKKNPVVESEEKKSRIVNVSDLAEAKSYVAENFGVSRTLLRTKASIVEYALQHGVEFEGI